MLENKVAIVTGASEGIGFGISQALANQGVKVYLVARTPEKLDSARAKIVRGGGRAEIKPADITNFEAMKKIIDDVYDAENKIDIFVNNAGLWKEQSINTPFEEVWQLIEFLGKAPFQISQYLVQKFQDKKDNPLKVLTVSSQAGLEIMDGNLGYNPGKMLLTAGMFALQREIETAKIEHINFYRLYPNTVATEKMMPAIKKGIETNGKEGVTNPVSLEAVVNSAVDLLLDKTPTRDVRVGYYPGRGIVRTYFPSDPAKFYYHTKQIEEVVNSDFRPEQLLK